MNQITQMNEVADEISINAHLTYISFTQRNERQFADYEETVLHVLATTSSGSRVSRWSLKNGKFIDEDMLERMAADGLLAKITPKRPNMWICTDYYRAI